MRELKDTLLVVLFTLAVIGALLISTPEAESAVPSTGWTSKTATWYGPKFYGNPMACGGTYSILVPGIAHPSIRCGTPLSIRRGRRYVNVRVVDHCPASYCFDLTAHTAMTLCRCRKPYTMGIQYRYGWINLSAPRPTTTVR